MDQKITELPVFQNHASTLTALKSLKQNLKILTTDLTLTMCACCQKTAQDTDVHLSVAAG